MRIGFDAKRAFANKTGLGNYSRFVLEALTTFQPEHDYLAYTPKNRQNLFPAFPESAIHFPESFLDKKLSPYWRYSSITNQLKKDHIEVFHGLSNEIPQRLQKVGIRSVVTIHDLIFERLPHLFKSIDRMIYRHKFKSACERADVVIAISEQTKRDLIELYDIERSKIQVIYQDCNPVFKEKKSQYETDQILSLYDIQEPYILSVGTLEERKNQHRLVEAFAALKNREFNLLLIGKPTPYIQTIKDCIARFGLEKQVKLLHNAPTEHLPALYQRAEIFAYISIYEGFGIPVLEALHSGTPVLAARGSCLEEAGGPGGLYADPYQTKDISHQLKTLMNDAFLRKSLIVAGQEHIAQFTGEHIARQLADIYKSLT
ncbi:MAG: glycosyltransferase family 1 protein [Dyadobacter sp.]|uniref:glycosyltransferase family 4 protein n=1 Tax=Dyadobacter sp. TaxID=1914288 RepID=UPI003264B8C9